MKNLKKPVIGLTTYQRERNAYCVVVTDYIDAIFAAGGIPVCIPSIESEEDTDYYLSIIDGLLLTGGNDMCPRYYGEEPLKEVNNTSSVRDKYEIELFNRAYKIGMPIFGVCRGHQVINVCLGGTLYQDINRQLPESFGHYPKETSEDELYHSVNINKGTMLHSIMQEESTYVNSFHHQSIKGLGDDLAVSAISKDGIVEAVESTQDRFLMGIQWHPESLIRKHPEFLKLFTSFCGAADEYKTIRLC